MILLVVVVAGLSALILLVNPNDFRAYMVQQVEARSGYQLSLEGPLRWHVWPQLSILSGRMSLTAPGASQPIVMADNMRLDVALLPLFSHQLQVQQVMIKDAVVQLIPQSEALKPKDTPVGPNDKNGSQEMARAWSFDIAKLKVVDSVLVYQNKTNEQITFRDINLDMSQDAAKQAEVELSMRINRDQRDIAFSLQGGVDLSDYPHQLTANITDFTYQIQGAGLLPEGIKGKGGVTFNWQQSSQKLSLSALQLTANDSDLQGNVALTLTDIPQWEINLQSGKLDLDSLLVRDSQSGDTAQPGAGQSNLPRPVIAQDRDDGFQTLRNMNATLNLRADSLNWRGLNFSAIQAAADNKQGMLTVSKLYGKLGNGSLSLPGSLDARGAKTQYIFRPDINNIDMSPLLAAFNYPGVLSGQFSLKGALSGDDLSAEAFRRHWQGDARLSLANARLQGMNFQQLIQQAVSRSSAGVDVLDSYENATTLTQLTTDARLNNGNLQLSQLVGESDMLSLTGGGTLNLVQQVCDAQFNIRVHGGWRGSNSKLITLLETTTIPLRVYGPWQQLSYSLPIEQVLRNLLQSDVKSRVNKWLDNHTEQRGINDLKRLLNDL